MSHEWQEATCTTPKTCSVGGETEGEALQADFEKYGLVCNAKVDTLNCDDFDNLDCHSQETQRAGRLKKEAR